MYSNLRRICPKISFDVLNPTSSKASRNLNKKIYFSNIEKGNEKLTSDVHNRPPY